MSSAGGQLGNIVAGKAPKQVDVRTLRMALAHAGLDEAMAGDLSPSKAVRRAMNDMKSGRVIRSLRRVDENTLTFQITSEVITSRQADYNREATVTLDVKAGTVTADVPFIEAEAQRLLNKHLGLRVKSDHNGILHRIFDKVRADLIPIRDEGGAYFVPDWHSGLVRQVRELLFHIGGKLRVFSVRLGDADTAESVAESTAEYLSELISEYRESCSGLTSESRPDVLARKLEKAAEIKRKLDCFRILLGGWADSVSAELAQAENELLAKMAEQAAESAA